MICKNCGNEYDEINFDVCPFCLTAPILEASNIKNDKSDTNENSDTLETQSEINSLEQPTEQNDINYEEVNILDCLDLSVRAKNVLLRNRITTVADLITYYDNGKFEATRGAGKKTIDEINMFISELLKGNASIAKEKELPPTSIPQKIIEGIENGDLQNIHINRLYDLSNRTYNTLATNNLTSILELALFLQENSVDDLRRAGSVAKKEIYDILSNYLNGNYNEDNTSFKKNAIEEYFNEEKINASRNYNVVLRRAKHDTLQEIGDEIKLSRERVRQIEAKFIRKYFRTVEYIVQPIIEKDGYFKLNDLSDYFSDEDNRLVAQHILKQDGKYEYLSFANCIVESKEKESTSSKILQLVIGFIGDGIDIDDCYEELDESFKQEGFFFMGQDELLSFFEEYNFKVYGSYVAPKSVSYTQLCRLVLNEYFPNGLKTTQDNNAICEDLDILRKIVKEKYGEELPAGNRALTARLADNFIIRDRGKIITKENVQIDLTVLNKIKEEIDDYEVDNVYYSELYAKNEGLLSLTSNIDNYYFLHGVLMLYYPYEYEYHRDYLIRCRVDGQVISNAERINNFILEQKRPVSKDEIKKAFPGFSDIMIELIFEQEPNLFRWDYHMYSSTDLIIIDVYEKKELENNLKVLLERNGIVSDKKLYSVIKTNMPLMLERNNIDNAVPLFYYVAKLFKESLDYRRPNLVKKGLIENCKYTMKELSLYLLGYPDFISYDRYQALIEEMMWTSVSASMTFFSIEEDYIRTSNDIYVKNDLFNLSADVIQSIKTSLDKMMQDNKYLPLINIVDYSDFPEIEYEWNYFLLESIIRKYIPTYTLVAPDYKDRRYQKNIIIDSALGIDSYSQLIAHILKSEGYSSISEGKLSSFLAIRGLARMVIPKELAQSKYFKFKDETYTIY